MQRRMIGIILGIRMVVGESLECLGRRRTGTISALQKKFGYWSKGWACAIVGWAEHLERLANEMTWAARLPSLRAFDELAWRRQLYGRP